MGKKSQPPRLKKGAVSRRGVASLLAMLYLILFASLAIGFYASVNTAAQVSHNEQKTVQAQLAAESGMEFARYHLHQVIIPPTAGTALLSEVVKDLQAQLDGTPNLKGRNIAVVNNVLQIPGDARNAIELPNGAAFRASIEAIGSGLRVKVTGGRGGEIARVLQLDYVAEQYPPAIFAYGLASRSRVVMNSNSRIMGNPASLGAVLSTATVNPVVSMGSNTKISGDVSFTSDSSSALSQRDSATIAGFYASDVVNVREHIHFGVDLPEFPTVDTSMFEPFATTLIDTPGVTLVDKTVRNVRIKAGTNPTFDGGSLIQGVVYVETPNVVTFNSNCRVQGVIAVQNNPTGTPLTNRIVFESNCKVEGVEVLDPVVFGKLTELGGACILAPSFNVRVNSNFGVAGGSVIAGGFHFDSNAYGTIKGSVICLENTSVSFDGNSGLFIEPSLNGKIPFGMKFSARFRPDPRTYLELSAEE